ncbi:DUF3131 domain-containing protein [Shewanella surugensis]|uniref:DUF3131 domain-containing protein n=1 Tax=Shewanella surugensis TaxID=212020 RepID=A0ABT0LC68_9GAMM|nr:DUF3131 domain-containing protein [Shewanella surugensis]MCL1125240.1 DUF3131 domain-containing protein [Shewanella surugensis]
MKIRLDYQCLLSALIMFISCVSATEDDTELGAESGLLRSLKPHYQIADHEPLPHLTHPFVLIEQLQTDLFSHLLPLLVVVESLETDIVPSYSNGASFSRSVVISDGKLNERVDNLPVHFQRRAVIPNINEMQESSDNVSGVKISARSRIEVIPLTRQELLLLSKAQRFMEDNWNDVTGFIDSVNGYTQTTMWDLGSAISGILALEALGVVESQLTQIRLEKLLATLMSMPLYDNKLPNRQYNTVTGLPSGPYSKSASHGNGWSALDLGRLYIWLEVIKQQKPQLSHQVDKITDKWKLEDAVKGKTLFGIKLTSKGEHFRQEGRLGYLQYAAKGYQLAGLNVDKAYDCRHLGEVEVEEKTLLIDKRNLPFFTLDPYLLYAIEVGRPKDCWFQLNTLYQLHKQHFERFNRLLVYAEDSLNRKPWFLYNNIYYQGDAWWSVSSSGKEVPKQNVQIFSNKAALAMSMLFDDEYATLLADKVIKNSLKHYHVPTGLFSDGAENVAYNINTNAFILVSLWFKSRNYTPILM